MSLYAQLPEWQEYRAHLDERRRLHGSLVQGATAAQQQHREAVAAHRAAVEEAVRAGQPIPTDEPPPPGDSLRHAVITSQQVLDAMATEGRQVRGRLAPAVEALAEARYAEIVEEVRAAVDAINTASVEVTAILQDLSAARAAADETAGITVRPSRSARTRNAISAGELAEHVRAGISPLKVLGFTQPLGRTDTVVLGLADYQPARDPGDGGEEMRRLRRLPPAAVPGARTPGQF